VKITESFPPGTFGKTTKFRWRQLNHAGKKFDNWNLENISIVCYGSGNGTSSFTWVPSSSLSDTTLMNPYAFPISTTTYTVSVDDSGCITSDTFTIEVLSMSLSTSSDTSVCLGDSANLSVFSNIPSAQNSWAPASGLSCTNCTTPLAAPSTTTTYTITSTTANCSLIDSVTVTILPLPIANAGNDTAMCLGTSITLSASGGVSYNWSPSDGLSAANISNPVASDSTARFYTVVVTSGTGCKSTDTIHVNVIKHTVRVSSVIDSICLGDSVQLNSEICSEFSEDFDPGIRSSIWEFITGGIISTDCGSVNGNALYFNDVGDRKAQTNSVNISGGATLDFYLKIAGGGAPCENADPGEDVVLEYTIDNGLSWNIVSTYDESMYPTFTQITEILSGGALSPFTIFRWRQLSHDGLGLDNWALDDINLTCTNISSTYTFNWTPGTTLSDSTVSNPNAGPSTNTTYTLSVSDSLCTAVDSISINVNVLVIVADTEQIICSGQAAQLIVSSTVPNLSYTWSPSTDLSCSTCQNPVATPSVTTTYTVIGSSVNCSDTDFVKIIVISPLPFASAGPDTSLCSGDTIQLNASGGQSYSWSPGFLLNDSTIASPITSPISNSNFKVTVIDTNGCIDIDSMVLTVFTPPLADAGPDTSLCQGDSVQLNAAGAVSFSWSPGGSLSDSMSMGPFAFPLVTTTYTVNVTDTNGCTGNDDVTVTVLPAPIANAGPDTTVCSGIQVQLNATGGTSYSWNPSNGLSNPTIPNPTALPAGTITYTVTVSIGQCLDEDSITITIDSFTYAKFTIDSVVNKAVYVTSTSINYLNFKWDFGDGSTDTVNLNTSHTYAGVGTYIITLTVSNQCNSDTTSKPDPLSE